MKKKHSILFLLFFSLIVRAQNIVPNGSFEFYSSCPNGADQLNYASPWYRPTAGTSDYFNICGTMGFGVPLNIWGYQYPRTGNGYGEIMVYSTSTSNREYMQVQLTSPLVDGKLYCVEFYVSNAGLSSYSGHNPVAITEIGLFFSNTPVSSMGYTPLPVIPQIVSPTGVFLYDTTSWAKISGFYTSVGGGEQYITIGNFKNDASTDTIFIADSGINPQAYYFVDDVSIFDCDSLVGINENAVEDSFSLFPNPNNGNMTFKYALNQTDQGTLRIYDLTGKFIHENMLLSDSTQIEINLELNAGIYFYQVNSENGISHTGKFLIVK